MEVNLTDRAIKMRVSNLLGNKKRLTVEFPDNLPDFENALLTSILRLINPAETPPEPIPATHKGGAL